MFDSMRTLVSIGGQIKRFMRKTWEPGWHRFFSIFACLIIISFFVVLGTLKIPQTEYPKPQTLNEYAQAAYLNIKLESFSSADRLLRIQVNYWLDPDAATDADQSQDRQVRVWISKAEREPSSGESATNATPEQSGNPTVTITVTPRFGTPVTTIKQPSTLVLGTMSGEPLRFPFDRYSGSIGVQNDFNSALPFKFNIENHLAGFELTPESGGDRTATITLERNLIDKVIPFIPVVILLFYTSWVTYFLYMRKIKDNVSLVSNVALFLSILALRTLVVPNGIPLGCVFDRVLLFPLVIICISSVRFVHEVISLHH